MFEGDCVRCALAFYTMKGVCGCVGYDDVQQYTATAGAFGCRCICSTYVWLLLTDPICCPQLNPPAGTVSPLRWEMGVDQFFAPCSWTAMLQKGKWWCCFFIVFSKYCLVHRSLNGTDLFWKDQTWCKCMLILRGFPAISLEIVPCLSWL